MHFGFASARDFRVVAQLMSSSSTGKSLFSPEKWPPVVVKASVTLANPETLTSGWIVL
jgi:hypothetical protein